MDLRIWFLDKSMGLVRNLQGKMALDMEVIFPSTLARARAEACPAFNSFLTSLRKAVNFSLASEKTIVLELITWPR